MAIPDMYDVNRDLRYIRIIINPQRMREGYSTHFVCLCVCVCVTYDSGGYADLQR